MPRHRKFAIVDRSTLHMHTLELCSHGVSLQGAQQFLAGQPVSNADDRQHLAQMLVGDINKTPTPCGPVPIPYPNIGAK